MKVVKTMDVPKKPLTHARRTHTLHREMRRDFAKLGFARIIVTKIASSEFKWYETVRIVSQKLFHMQLYRLVETRTAKKSCLLNPSQDRKACLTHAL